MTLPEDAAPLRLIPSRSILCHFTSAARLNLPVPRKHGITSGRAVTPPFLTAVYPFAMLPGGGDATRSWGELKGYTPAENRPGGDLGSQAEQGMEPSPHAGGFMGR